MAEQQERLWEFDAVEPGQAGASTVVDITAENIAEYARVSLNDHPRYRADGGRSIPMPTMVLSYAPLLRDEIPEANGFVALEQSKTARRQTPFAKCEIRWERPVKAGDSITGTRRVLEKYERRGSKFVTFRVEASNQEGQRVASYDYTCIFEYAKGQRDTPDTSVSASLPPAERRIRPLPDRLRPGCWTTRPPPRGCKWRRCPSPRAKKLWTARTASGWPGGPMRATSIPTKSSPGRISSAAR